jgi:hypothetical protein
LLLVALLFGSNLGPNIDAAALEVPTETPEEAPKERTANAAARGLHFRRVDREWGIDFVHGHGGSGRYYMVEANGGGILLFDFDNDGDTDIFLANGASLPGYEGPRPRCALYRNDGKRGFSEISHQAGLEIPVYASGGSAGDVDGDGDLDLYITAFGRNLLYLNEGGGTFRLSPATATVADPSWSSSAAFADVDRDGDLDLYVVNYVDFSLENNKACGDQKRNLRGYCGPDVYRGVGDRFYRNRGDGTFEDHTTEAGFGQALGAGLALSFGDLDDDGDQDLYVANDLTANFLYLNRGDGTFQERALLAGTAFGDRGLAEASMGIDLGDLDGDGRFDILVTNYEGETHALYGNGGSLLFTDRRFASGLAEPTLRMLAFGIASGDFDHDGDLDLVMANGHVRENAAAFNRLSTYKQPNQIFENLLGQGRFREVKNAGLSAVEASRGLALGDLDQDGDLDLVISNVGGPVEVYENLSPKNGQGWLQVQLRSSHGEPFAIGARVVVHTGDRVQHRELRTGSSFMSQHDLPLHFGLGQAKKVDRLVVHWPDGSVQTLRDVEAGQRLRIVQPTEAAVATAAAVNTKPKAEAKSPPGT